MKNTAKKQAMLDMQNCKIQISVFEFEKALLEFTRVSEDIAIRDFRKFNGGHNKKHK